MFDGPIALNVKIVMIQPEDYYDRVVQALRVDQDGTNAKEGLQFDIVYDPNKVVYLHEQYETTDRLNEHNAADHTNDIFEMVHRKIDKVFSEFIVNKYQCTHQPIKIVNKMGPSHFCLNVESNIKPEYRNEFIQLMTSHQQHSKSEPGCIQFDWGVSLDDSNTFYQHEQFLSFADFQYHETTEHFHKFMEFNKRDPYTKPQTVHKFTLL